MKIMTIVRHVPDAEARVAIEDQQVVLSGAAWVLDGMDEYGVEQALRMRDDGMEVEIVALALGSARSEEALRTALAMGADRARLLETDEEPDVLSAARDLADVIRDEAPDLVLLGGKQADWDSAGLGPAIAELLGWPLSDWTTQMHLDDRVLVTTHDADVGTETLTMTLPAVVTTQQGLNEPRYPTLPNIMKAKRKELVREPARAHARTTRVTERALERRDREQRMLQGSPVEVASDLARILHEATA